MNAPDADNGRPSKPGTHVPRQRWIEIPEPMELARLLKLASRGKTQAAVAERYGVTSH